MADSIYVADSVSHRSMNESARPYRKYVDSDATSSARAQNAGRTGCAGELFRASDERQGLCRAREEELGGRYVGRRVACRVRRLFLPPLGQEQRPGSKRGDRGRTEERQRIRRQSRSTSLETLGNAEARLPSARRFHVVRWRLARRSCSRELCTDSGCGREIRTVFAIRSQQADSRPPTPSLAMLAAADKHADRRSPSDTHRARGSRPRATLSDDPDDSPEEDQSGKNGQ